MSSLESRISWRLRTWLAVEVVFGVASVLSVALAPGNTKTNFAWPINPVVMAAVLGGFYVSTAPLFLLPAFAKRWEMVRVMILPAALFCAMQLVATFVHWNKFSHGTFPFVVWFASYLLPPPIFVGAYYFNQRSVDSKPAYGVEGFPRWLKRILECLGAGLLLGAALVFVFPRILIPIFPWKLSPLTARTFSAWHLAFGALLLSTRRENDRTRSVLVSPTLMIVLPAVVVQMLRYSDQVRWASPVLWIGLLIYAILGFCGLYLATGRWREALS